MTVIFSIFNVTTGLYVKTLEAPDFDNVLLNMGPDEIAVAGSYDESYYYTGGEPSTALRPLVPLPEVDSGNNHIYRWDDPPVGLHAKVYDLWTIPPTLLVDTDLSAPNCGLYLIEGGVDYRIELSAPFPYLDNTLEVSQ